MRTILIFLLMLCVIRSQAQSNVRPYNCGYVSKDSIELRKNFERFSRYFQCKSGERVASVGAANGYLEVQIAAFVPNVTWTIQDIDSTCLNAMEFNRVLAHHERILNRKIEGDFTLVLGTTTRTNLTPSTYDRILLSNVYHEITERSAMLLDMYSALKQDGVLVIMERMAQKPGQRHGDCKHQKLWEPEFIRELNAAGFQLMEKAIPDKKMGLTFYILFKAS